MQEHAKNIAPMEVIYFGRSVYLFLVDSVFRALWLATQSVNILHYSLIHLQYLGTSDAKLV